MTIIEDLGAIRCAACDEVLSRLVRDPAQPGHWHTTCPHCGGEVDFTFTVTTTHVRRVVAMGVHTHGPHPTERCGDCSWWKPAKDPAMQGCCQLCDALWPNEVRWEGSYGCYRWEQRKPEQKETDAHTCRSAMTQSQICGSCFWWKCSGKYFSPTEGYCRLRQPLWHIGGGRWIFSPACHRFEGVEGDVREE